MRSKSITFGIAALAIAALGGATSFAQTSAGEGAVKRIEKLPIDALMLVEDAQGRITFQTPSGRFIIRGQLYDTWGGYLVDSPDAARRSMTTLPMDRVPMAQLGAITVGAGTDQVVVFVDPLCPHCHRLMAAIDQLVQSSATRWRFDILVLPVLGRDSEIAARQIECAADVDAARTALITGTSPAALQQKPTCDLQHMSNRLITAQLIGIKGVPLIIAPDGRLQQGVPDNLLMFLEG
ncbi:MAG: disulfide isomerase [Tistrella sp.]|nr:disulfide isomerase [Tistrella sp.]MBA76579.1 disulfide isomerase [Tistrella sp.]MBA76633.1 disulfide isomerase [Tistrella sp.]